MYKLWTAVVSPINKHQASCRLSYIPSILFISMIIICIQFMILMLFVISLSTKIIFSAMTVVILV